jgi:DNA-binding transcriptional LysR family regulator
MRRRHPRVEVLTEPFEALESMTALAQGELHLVVGFVPEGQVMRPDPAVRVRFLAREPIWVAVPASSPWARRRELDVRALRGAVWVAPPPGTLRTVFDQVAADAGFQPDVRHQTSDSTAIRALVATGQAVTLSAPTVPSSDDVTVLPLTGDAHRRLFTAWNPAVLDPAQARVLLQTVRSWYDDQVDAAPRYRRWLAARSGGVSRGRSA